jgi:hypothetical protein
MFPSVDVNGMIHQMFGSCGVSEEGYNNAFLQRDQAAGTNVRRLLVSSMQIDTWSSPEYFNCMA